MRAARPKMEFVALQHDASAPRRLDGLQLGRAAAALTVVVGHAVDHAMHGMVSESWQLGARYGVTLFFVISGFIMVQTTGQGRFDPGAFISRRIRRVVPIYWFVTLLVALTVLIAPAVFKRTVFDLQHLAASLFFIPMYDPGSTDISPMFRLGWTLNFEMFFYVAFMLTFALGLVSRAVALTLFFLACVLIGQTFTFEAAVPRFYTQVDTLGFVAGVWLGVLNMKGWLRADGRAIAALFAASTAILAYILFHYAAIRNVTATQLWLVAACTAHIALMLMLIDFKAWRVPRPLLYIGDASYSIYLFHMFAIGAVTAVILRLPKDMLVPMVFVSAVSGCIAGLVAYRFIEQPLNRLMRGRRPLTAAQIGEGAATAPLVAPSTETQ